MTTRSHHIAAAAATDAHKKVARGVLSRDQSLASIQNFGANDGVRRGKESGERAPSPVWRFGVMPLENVDNFTCKSVIWYFWASFLGGGEKILTPQQFLLAAIAHSPSSGSTPL